MNKALKFLFLVACATIYLFAPSTAQTCQSYTFSNNAVYASCADLPVLSSFLHWTYDQSAGQFDIAFRHTGTSSSRWVAWAINPNGKQMLGSQALLAFQNSSGLMHAYTMPVNSMSTSLQEGDLSFEVSNLRATLIGDEMTIFATVHLGNLSTTIDHVWQEGPVINNVLGAHSFSPANMNSFGSVNFLSGQTAAGRNSRMSKRIIHGVLNTVSWGILMPLGAVMARYLKVFKSGNPAWFYLHVGCQVTAYVVGVAGWATGMKLGSDSPDIQYNPHRTIGILLFCLGTLQAFALRLRPKPDHKYRRYWNMYHHGVGYTVIILSIINVYLGLEILKPGKMWKRIYSAIVIILGSVALVLEAVTWHIVIRRRRANTNTEKHSHAVNGTDDVNGDQVV